MKLLTAYFIALTLLTASMVHAEWPISNDPAFDASVRKPAYPESQGPRILLDGGHHNFFIQWNFIKPFSELAEADEYRPVTDDETFTLNIRTRTIGKPGWIVFSGENGILNAGIERTPQSLRGSSVQVNWRRAWESHPYGHPFSPASGHRHATVRALLQ